MNNEIKRIAERIVRDEYATSEDVDKLAQAYLHEREWISVEDRLPDDLDMHLIVYYENDAGSGATVADVYFEHSGFNIRRCTKEMWSPMVGVTHWMPLPPEPEQ